MENKKSIFSSFSNQQQSHAQPIEKNVLEEIRLQLERIEKKIADIENKKQDHFQSIVNEKMSELIEKISLNERKMIDKFRELLDSIYSKTVKELKDELLNNKKTFEKMEEKIEDRLKDKNEIDYKKYLEENYDLIEKSLAKNLSLGIEKVILEQNGIYEKNFSNAISKLEGEINASNKDTLEETKKSLLKFEEIFQNVYRSLLENNNSIEKISNTLEKKIEGVISEAHSMCENNKNGIHEMNSKIEKYTTDSSQTIDVIKKHLLDIKTEFSSEFGKIKSIKKDFESNLKNIDGMIKSYDAISNKAFENYLRAVEDMELGNKKMKEEISANIKKLEENTIKIFLDNLGFGREYEKIKIYMDDFFRICDSLERKIEKMTIMSSEVAKTESVGVSGMIIKKTKLELDGIKSTLRELFVKVEEIKFNIGK